MSYTKEQAQEVMINGLINALANIYVIGQQCINLAPQTISRSNPYELIIKCAQSAQFVVVHPNATQKEIDDYLDQKKDNTKVVLSSELVEKDLGVFTNN